MKYIVIAYSLDNKKWIEFLCTNNLEEAQEESMMIKRKLNLEFSAVKIIALENSKKYLRKNEIRLDLNPEHLNRFGYPHDAVITAKKGHKMKANTRTHSEYVNGVRSLDLEPNLPKDVRHKRISPPFWQSEKQFGPVKGKATKQLRSKIKNYNKKFYK